MSDKKLTRKRNGGAFFKNITAIKMRYEGIKRETKKKYRKMKIETQKTFNYFTSHNPITIYLKYYNNCFSETVVKNSLRCQSLTIDYDFGMLIFSIIKEYVCNENRTTIDFSSILEKYVQESMGKSNISNNGGVATIQTTLNPEHNEIYNQLKNVIKANHSNYSDDNYYLNYYLIYQYEKNDINKFKEIKDNIKTYEESFLQEALVNI